MTDLPVMQTDCAQINAQLQTKPMAAILSASPVTLQRYARTGRIPARKIGRRWRFEPTAVLAALGTQAVEVVK
jgi:excisionase family DNA binding protein